MGLPPWDLQRRLAAWMNGSGRSGYGKGLLSFQAFVRALALDHNLPPDSSLEDVYEKALGSLPFRGEKQVRASLDPGSRWAMDPFLKPLLELRDYVREFFSEDEILGFYVHGSLATMDYVPGYSDMDTLVVIRKKVLDDPAWAEDIRRRLVRCNGYLYLLDPLQHHPHFILTEMDLSHHFEPLFPTVLFQHAADLSAFDRRLMLRFHDPERLLKEVFENFCSYLTCPGKYGMKGKNSYQLKKYVQCVLLMPTIYLQALTGKYLYKRDSFQKVRGFLPSAAMAIVDKASQVRSACRFKSWYPLSVRRLAGVRMHYRLLHRIHRDLDRSIVPQIKRILGPDYLEDARKLVETMRLSLQEEGKYGLENSSSHPP